jgi:prepilin-type N-terminal cleavage/methylation domain-containing protein
MRTPCQSRIHAHRRTIARGFSLIETLIAVLVLTVGAIGMASVFLYGMQSASSSPNDLIATQKAAEAIESVFSARDSHTLTWAQLRNTANGGVFLGGARDMTTPGLDGILDTADDGGIESVDLPGPDQLLGTGDDTTQTLSAFKRQIAITDSGDNLRIVTVTITYPSGPMTRTYSVTVYMSSFA